MIMTVPDWAPLYMYTTINLQVCKYIIKTKGRVHKNDIATVHNVFVFIVISARINSKLDTLCVAVCFNHDVFVYVK